MAKKAEVTQEVEVEEIFSAKDLAVQAGTDPKTFRRFLRSEFPRTNKGERYSFSDEARIEVLAAFEARIDSEEVPQDDDES